MKSGEVVGLAVFGVLVVAALFFAIRQSRRQTEAMKAFAEARGWSYLGTESRVNTILNESFKTQRWSAMNLVSVKGGGFLFQYTSRPAVGRSSGTGGFGCLLEHGGRAVTPEVEVTRRVPGLEKLVSGRREAGGSDFRRECMVICDDEGVAARVVNGGVESILLEHFTNKEYVLSAQFSGQSVLVTSSWATTPEEWEYLVDLARRLAAAVR